MGYSSQVNPSGNADGIIGERWHELQAVTVPVQQYIVPGIPGVQTVDLTTGIPHQWMRVGHCSNDSATLASLRYGEGQSALVQKMDTIRYGSINVWLVRTEFPNPGNLLNKNDSSTGITEYIQTWQEAPASV